MASFTMTNPAKTVASLHKSTPGSSTANGNRSERFDSHPVTHQQSLGLVQIMFLTAVSSICELRNLLPQDHFEGRNLSSIRKDLRDISLNDPQSLSMRSCQDIELSSSQAKSKKHKLFMIIKRASSIGTEKLYKWMDGIFHGIQQRCIESVQMSIIAEKHKPEHVLESYLFSLQYSSGSDNKSKVDMSLTSSVGSKSVTFASARSSLYNLMATLNHLLRMLPELPDERYLTFNIFFQDERPIIYNPFGFRASNRTTMLVPDTKTWSMEDTSRLGHLRTGRHTIDLKIAHLATFESDSRNIASTDTIPASLPFNRVLSRRTFCPMPNVNVLIPAANRFEARSRMATPSTPSTVSRTSRVESFSFQVQTSGNAQRSDSQTEVLMQASAKALRLLSLTQTFENNMYGHSSAQGSSASTMQSRLRSMIRSPSVQPNITQTQDPNPNEQIEVPWGLNEGKMNEMYAKRDTVISQAHYKSSIAEVRCICGYDQMEGQMFTCDCCDKWQHQHCYGLDMVSDRFFKEVRACYPCLLDSDEKLLETLRETARLRRACWTIRSAKEALTKDQIVQRLAYEKNEIEDLLLALEKAGIVELAANRFGVSNTTVHSNLEMQGIMHPLFRISNLYEPLLESGGESSPPQRSPKRGLEIDLCSSDTQDLDTTPNAKRRKSSPNPSTPHRGSVIPVSSMEVLSPLDVRGQH